MSDAKESAKGMWTKYMILCGQIYDFCAEKVRVQRKHTPETLQISQKRGTWIVSVFIVLCIIGALTDDEEDSAVEAGLEASSEEVCANNSDGDAYVATTDGDYALKDVDVKIKSVCGLRFGATKEQCKQLLYEIKEGDEFANCTANNKEIRGRLKKPWRMFTEVKLVFTGVERVPSHLWKIHLESDRLDFRRISEDSCEEEIRKVKELLERKFDIKLKGNRLASKWYEWYGNKESINELRLDHGNISDKTCLRLEVTCPRVIEIDESIQKSQGEKINISADEGADQL